MEVGATEMLIGGGGTAAITTIVTKYIVPMIKTALKNRTDENKLKIKLSAGKNEQVADIWKKQYDDLKIELKDVTEHKLQLEIKLATLRERLLRYTQHSRGGNHAED